MEKRLFWLIYLKTFKNFTFLGSNSKKPCKSTYPTAKPAARLGGAGLVAECVEVAVALGTHGGYELRHQVHGLRARHSPVVPITFCAAGKCRYQAAATREGISVVVVRKKASIQSYGGWTWTNSIAASIIPFLASGWRHTLVVSTSVGLPCTGMMYCVAAISDKS